MGIVDLGTKVPQHVTHSHLSKASKKRSLSPSSHNARPISPEVVSRVEARRSELVQAIYATLDGKQLAHSFQWYYTTVEKLCRFKPSEQPLLCKLLYDAIERFYTDAVFPRVRDALVGERTHGSSGEITESRARDYLEVCSEYLAKLSVLTKVFLYLDRSYLKQHPLKVCIVERGLQRLLDDLTNSSTSISISNNTSNSKDNTPVSGENTPRDDAMDVDTPSAQLLSPSLLNAILQMSGSLLRATRLSQFGLQDPIWKDDDLSACFMTHLIKMNHSFPHSFPLNRVFIDKAVLDHSIIAKQTLKNSPSQYFECYKTYLKNEIGFMERCNASTETQRLFEKKLSWCWLYKNLNAVLRQIFPQITRDSLVELYRLCREAEQVFSIDACNTFKYEWNENLCQQATTAMRDADAKGEPLVPLIVGLNNEFNKPSHSVSSEEDRLISDLEFELRNAIAKALNNAAFASKVSTQLCAYCDQYLKRSKQQAQQLHQTLSQDFRHNVMAIFKLLSNKSTFISNYKRELSRRLLFQKYSNIKLEKALAEEICSMVGDDSDLVKMLDEMASEDKPYRNDISSPEGFQPVILTKSAWPEFPGYTKLDTIVLPPSLQTYLDGFQAAFAKIDKNNERMILDWNYFNYHQLTITADFDLGKKDLSLNLLQAAILLLFTDDDVSLTCDQVAERLSLGDSGAAIAQSGLASLCERYKILAVDQATGTYTFNAKFTDKSSKIKVPYKGPAAIGGSTENAPSKAAPAATRARSDEIRALIVKTLKAETELAYTTVVAMTIKKLEDTGPIKIADIKANIEQLISTEFVKRVGDKLRYIP